MSIKISDKSKQTVIDIAQYFNMVGAVKLLSGNDSAIQQQLDNVAANDPKIGDGSKRKRIGYKKKIGIGDKLSKLGGSDMGAGSTVVLSKIYKLMENSYEKDVRRKELAKDREEENRLEDNRKHKELVDAIIKSRGTTVNIEGGEEKDDSETKGFFAFIKDKMESIFGLFGKFAGLLGSLGKFVAEGSILGLITTVVSSAIGFVMGTIGKLLSATLLITKFTTAALIRMITSGITTLWTLIPVQVKAIVAGVGAVLLANESENSMRRIAGQKEELDRRWKENEDAIANEKAKLAQAKRNPSVDSKNYKDTAEKNLARFEGLREGYQREYDTIRGQMELRKGEGTGFGDMMMASIDEEQYKMTGFSFGDELKKIEGYQKIFSNLSEFIKMPSFDMKNMSFSGPGLDTVGIASRMGAVDQGILDTRNFRNAADKDHSLYTKLGKGLRERDEAEQLRASNQAALFGGGRGSQGGATAEQVTNTNTGGTTINDASNNNNDLKREGSLPSKGTTTTNTTNTNKQSSPSVERSLPKVRTDEESFINSILKNTEMNVGH